MTQNKTVLAWIKEMADMCKPDKKVWIDGSEEQLEALRAEKAAKESSAKNDPESGEK